MVELRGEDENPLGGDPTYGFLIRNESRSVYEVLRRIREGQYIMAPDFQRPFVWNENKQSRLIESVIMRIPLPVFYVAQERDGRMVVVDGLQRLYTFKRFVEGDLKLKLGEESQLSGKKFGDLPKALTNRIEDCNLTFYILDPRVPEQTRLAIFRRVNSGAPLTDQQMRNALYNGAGTRFLAEAAKTDSFKRVTDDKLSTPGATNDMEDRYYVNRFCAFHLLGVEAYQGNMSEFLRDSIIYMNKMDKGELDTLGSQFRNGLDNNFTVFGRNAFKQPESPETYGPLRPALWDVMTTELAGLDSGLVKSRRGELWTEFHRLTTMDDPFIRNFTNRVAPDGRRRVEERFRKTREMLKGVLK